MHLAGILFINLLTTIVEVLQFIEIGIVIVVQSIRRSVLVFMPILEGYFVQSIPWRDFVRHEDAVSYGVRFKGQVFNNMGPVSLTIQTGFMMIGLEVLFEA